jgi:hypothetical protein
LQKESQKSRMRHALHVSCQLVIARGWLIVGNAQYGLSCATALRRSMSSKDNLLKNNPSPRKYVVLYSMVRYNAILWKRAAPPTENISRNRHNYHGQAITHSTPTPQILKSPLAPTVQFCWRHCFLLLSRQTQMDNL